jgi:hypothetical protein
MRQKGGASSHWCLDPWLQRITAKYGNDGYVLSLACSPPMFQKILSLSLSEVRWTTVGIKNCRERVWISTGNYVVLKINVFVVFPIGVVEALPIMGWANENVYLLGE